LVVNKAVDAKFSGSERMFETKQSRQRVEDKEVEGIAEVHGDDAPHERPVVLRPVVVPVDDVPVRR